PLSPSSLHSPAAPRDLHSFPTRRSSDLGDHGARQNQQGREDGASAACEGALGAGGSGQRIRRSCRHGYLLTVVPATVIAAGVLRSEEHTSELQSRFDLVCRLLLEKKK